MSIRTLNSQAGSSFRNARTGTMCCASTMTVSSPNVIRVSRTVSGSDVLRCAARSSRVAMSAFYVSRAADFPLEQHDAINQRFRGGRTPGHIDVHRHDAVAAAHDSVGVVI